MLDSSDFKSSPRFPGSPEANQVETISLQIFTAPIPEDSIQFPRALVDQ